MILPRGRAQGLELPAASSNTESPIASHSCHARGFTACSAQLLPSPSLSITVDSVLCKRRQTYVSWSYHSDPFCHTLSGSSKP